MLINWCVCDTAGADQRAEHSAVAAGRGHVPQLPRTHPSPAGRVARVHSPPPVALQLPGNGGQKKNNKNKNKNKVKTRGQSEIVYTYAHNLSDLSQQQPGSVAGCHQNSWPGKRLLCQGERANKKEKRETLFILLLSSQKSKL